ncbi:two-component system, cell cycle sensor histidine kinase and response regulator CckA [Planctomycetaceae bacterium]|nr:two-component system, cell cycle sensor histidine kinase and response regulator CckA [Planctomycetaceae bacterium]
MAKGLRRTSKKPFVDEFDPLKLGQFLLEHADVLVFRLDARGKVQFANEFALRELGYTADELERRDFFSTVAPFEKERLAKLILGQATVLPVHARVELRSKSGQAKNCYFSAGREKDDTQAVVLLGRMAQAVEPSTLAQAGEAVLALFAHAPYAIFLHEAGLGRVLQANDLALKLAGWPREELVGRDLLELFPRLQTPRLPDGAQGVETWLRNRAGKLMPVSLSTSQFVLEGKLRSLCFVRDLSREKHAETERIASEARFKTALDRLQEGFCLLLPTGGPLADFKFSYANPAACESFKMPGGEMDKRTLRSLFDWETGERLCEILSEVQASGQDASFERFELSPGGNPAVFALYICRHGEGLAVTMRDETQRAQAGQALASKERNLSALLANLPMGVAFVEVGTGKPPLVNQHLRDLLGLVGEQQDPELFAPGHLYDLGGNVLDAKDLPARVAMRTGLPYRNDHLELRVPGREPCRLEVSVAPVLENARIVAIVAVFSDITARVALQTQLTQSQKMLALGTLAGGIAHDFNNVAQAISGSLELAKRSLTPEHKAFAGISAAQKAAARVTSLTHQLLSASSQRLEAIQTRDLGPLIEETASLLRGTIDKRISVETSLPPRLWAAVLEPGRMQQCVLNLALNARDAIEGNGRIVISAQNVHVAQGDPQLDPESEPGDYVALSVTDSGKGIPPEIIGRVFEPFFSTKAVGKGSGLGLAVVYANMKQVGGWVKVQSSSQGTSFTLFFRRGKRFTGPIPEVPENEEDYTQSGTERILVVDDEPEILDIASEILTDMGYAVETAQDGEAACARLRKRRDIDLVLLDLTMPRQGGAETLKTIREENLAPCVIVMSGFASGMDTEGLIKLGADAFLPKPYSLSQLIKTVREQLDLSK